MPARGRGRRPRRSKSLAAPAPPPRLLDRILDTPNLSRIVPQLPPQVLHRVIQSCGLEDCGEIVALATSGQLAAVLDLDLWRAEQPGLDEQFDADRFGVWLDVLVQSGDAVAARIIASMDLEMVVNGFAQHVRVVDPGSLMPTFSSDDEVENPLFQPEALSAEIGGYLVVARQAGSWDAIVSALLALAAEGQTYFHRVMRGCRRLSNDGYEVDGLSDLLADTDQSMFDVSFSRERRRDRQGYATPAQARAFLQAARQLRLGDAVAPPADPVARAYFRATALNATADADNESARLNAAPDPEPEPDDSRAVAAVVDLLVAEGVLPQPPRALLEGEQGQASRLLRMQAQMRFASEHDYAAYSARSEELAYLANTIMAGCSIQARPFTLEEASRAAVATCNLGLENWPRRWATVTDGLLIGQDLVLVFQAGWKILHDEVCMYAAEQLIAVLKRLPRGAPEIQHDLDALRVELKKQCQAGTPWIASEGLDVITSLDMPAWATLLGLIAECPVLHAGIAGSQGSRARQISPTDFEFISENSQIETVRVFMRTLPEILRA